MWRLAKTKGFRLGAVNGEAVPRKARVSLTRFAGADFLAPNSAYLGLLCPVLEKEGSSE